MDIRLTQVIMIFVAIFIVKIAIADPMRDGPVEKKTKHQYVKSTQIK